MAWGNVAKGAVKAAVKAPAPKSSWGNVAQKAAGGATTGAAKANVNPGGDPNLAAIMRQSGSTDPNDPYNWAGISRALQAQQALGGAVVGAATASGYDGGGGSGGGGSSYGGGGGGVSAVPSVVQAPTTVTTTPQVQAPTAVTDTAVGAPGASAGDSFTSLGGGGTFGSFDRMRNQRSPRTGLSMTPEMLRAAAAARLGSG